MKEKYKDIKFREVFKIVKINDYTIHIVMVDRRSISIQCKDPFETEREFHYLEMKRKEALNTYAK